MSFRPITRYVIKNHARFEMQRRGITEEQVHGVLSTPQQAEEVRPGRWVFQSRIIVTPPGREYLLRVFVDIDREPAEVVTMYRTSKIAKYWR
jgi:hypothetical protein